MKTFERFFIRHRFVSEALFNPSWILFVTFCLAVHNACPQRNPVGASIGYQVAGAERIVVGHIFRVGNVIPGDEPHHEHMTIDFQVEETLKGPAETRVSVTTYGEFHAILAARNLLCDSCPERSHRLLVIVSKRPLYSGLSVIDLDHPTFPEISSDLHVLDNGAAILKATRDEAHRYPGSWDERKVWSWGPSSTFMPGTKFHGYTIYVPIDDRQEEIAHQILRDQTVPNAVIGDYDNDRGSAVGVLKFFRSWANERLLLSLLTDQEVTHSAVGQLDYPVRREAFSTLKEWGIDIPAPVLTVKFSPDRDTGVQPCRENQLIASVDKEEGHQIEGGLGHHAQTLAIENRSVTACVLLGVPALSMVSATTQSSVPLQVCGNCHDYVFQKRPEAQVVLQPKQSAYVVLGFNINDGIGQCVQTDPRQKPASPYFNVVLNLSLPTPIDPPLKVRLQNWRSCGPINVTPFLKQPPQDGQMASFPTR